MDIDHRIVLDKLAPTPPFCLIAANVFRMKYSPLPSPHLPFLSSSLPPDLLVGMLAAGGMEADLTGKAAREFSRTKTKARYSV